MLPASCASCVQYCIPAIRVRQVTADDVAVVVLHLVKPPLPAHPGRPARIPPAAATSAAANDPCYLAASRAAAAAQAHRPSTAGAVPALALAASVQRAAPAAEADVLRAQQDSRGRCQPRLCKTLREERRGANI